MPVAQFRRELHCHCDSPQQRSGFHQSFARTTVCAACTAHSTHNSTASQHASICHFQITFAQFTSVACAELFTSCHLSSTQWLQSRRSCQDIQLRTNTSIHRQLSEGGRSSSVKSGVCAHSKVWQRHSGAVVILNLWCKDSGVLWCQCASSTALTVHAKFGAGRIYGTASGHLW